VMQECKFVENEVINLMMADFGGWPMAYATLKFHAKAARLEKDITREQCEYLLTQTRNSIAHRYQQQWTNDMKLGNEALKTIMLYSATGTTIKRDYRINGHSLNELEDSGLFSLSQPKDANANANANIVLIDMPLFVWSCLNSIPEFQLCDADTMNPLKSSWSLTEQLAIASLKTRFLMFASQKKTSVTISELRPGALCDKATGSIRVAVIPSENLRTVHTLSSHVLCPSTCKSNPVEFNPQSLPVEQVKLDVTKGGMVRAKEGQCNLDSLTYSPSLPPTIGSVALITQTKHRELESKTSKLSCPTICDVSQALLLLSQKAKIADAVVVEFFSDRPLSRKFAKKEEKEKEEKNKERKPWVPPSNVVVVCESNFAEVVGPIFAQRTRLRPAIDAMMDVGSDDTE